MLLKLYQIFNTEISQQNNQRRKNHSLGQYSHQPLLRQIPNNLILSNRSLVQKGIRQLIQALLLSTQIFQILWQHWLLLTKISELLKKHSTLCPLSNRLLRIEKTSKLRKVSCIPNLLSTARKEQSSKQQGR